MKAQTYRNVIDARTPADKISSHFNLQPRAYDTQNRKEKWTERMNNENKNKIWQYSVSAGPLSPRNFIETKRKTQNVQTFRRAQHFTRSRGPADQINRLQK